jgi:hypothetical protein
VSFRAGLHLDGSLTVTGRKLAAVVEQIRDLDEGTFMEQAAKPHNHKRPSQLPAGFHGASFNTGPIAINIQMTNHSGNDVRNCSLCSPGRCSVA